MASASKSFYYSSLDRSQEDSFRLLKLLPGRSDAPVQCSLTSGSRTALRGSYEALSYCWGDHRLSKTVEVDGSPFRITENLELALRSLRDDSRTGCRVRSLWVDAICINQDDVQERNQQVAQMQKIYADAEGVLIWLGAANPDSDLAISFIRGLCARLDVMADSRGVYEQLNRYRAEDLEETLYSYDAKLFFDSWIAVARLFQRPWWERAWIVQELVSARTATCYCGNSSVPWRQLALVIEFLNLWQAIVQNKASSAMPLEILSSRQLLNAWSLMDIKNSFDAEGYVPLFSLLHRNRHRHCLDPRDKVYAVLGLTDSETRALFRADYTKPVAWVYTMAAKFDIQSHGALEILTLVHHTEAVHQEYPSWVADFQQPSSLWRFNKFRTDTTCYGSQNYRRHSFSEDSQLIHVDGFYVDVVNFGNLQQSKGSFRWCEETASWSWNIECMTTRLVSLGGVQREGAAGGAPRQEDLYQTVEGVVYDVLIAGQLSTSSGWVSHNVTYAAAGGKGPPLYWENMLHHAVGQTSNRTVILSKNRYLGIAPLTCQPRDEIFILFGLKEPAILRPQQDGSYIFVGTAYIHGLMQGQGLEALRNGNSSVKRVTLR